MEIQLPVQSQLGHTQNIQRESLRVASVAVHYKRTSPGIEQKVFIRYPVGFITPNQHTLLNREQHSTTSHVNLLQVLCELTYNQNSKTTKML